jgi:O-glycosyl hydrolase
VGVWNFGGVSEWCETCEDWLAMGKPRQIDPALYPEVGESIASYILHLKNNGVPLRFAEVQNEPDIEAGIKYASPEALRDAGRVVIGMLDHFGLKDVQLHAPNLHSPNNNVPWIEAWFEDDLLRQRTVAVSYHTWWSQDIKQFDAIWKTARRYGKPVWATETGYHRAGNAISPNTWRTSWHYAKAHYRAIVWSHATRTYIWTLLGNDAAVGKDGERYPMFYVLQHFANSIPEGSILIESEANDPRVLPLVFRRPDGSHVAILLNDNRAERTCTMTGLDVQVSEWSMSSDGAYGVQGDPDVANGPEGITITLPPLSIASLALE